MNVFITVTQWQSRYKPPHVPVLRLVPYPAALGHALAQNLDFGVRVCACVCLSRTEDAIEEPGVYI